MKSIIDIENPAYTREESDSFFKFRNGQKVISKVHGFEGIISCRSYNERTGVGYDVLGTSLNQDMKEVLHTLEEPNMELLDDGKIHIDVIEPPLWPVALGSKVARIDNPDIAGPIYSYVEHSTGCLFARASRIGTDRDGIPLGGFYQNVNNLHLIEKVEYESEGTSGEKKGGPQEDASIAVCNKMEV